MVDRPNVVGGRERVASRHHPKENHRGERRMQVRNSETEHNHYQRERSGRALTEIETLESIAYDCMDVQALLERSETREHERRVN